MGGRTMVMKIAVVALAVAVLILMGNVKKQRRMLKDIMHFLYLNSCAYKELADKVEDVNDLPEFRSHFAEMKNFMRGQLKEVGAPVDEWDRECR